MGQINPFTGAMSLPQAPSVAERLRRSQAEAKNLSESEVEEAAIESPDALVSISDEHGQHSPGKREQKKENAESETEDPDQPTHLDISA
jgi:hypothetical protein